MTAGDEPPAAPRASGRARTALTSFVGRRSELTEIKRRLTESRLVTLTGPGGVGKTRLALEVAGRARRGLRDGFWIVELGSLRDDARVPQVVTAALELPDQSSRDPVDKLLRYLRTRQVLIVLDNCEHLLEACASLADTVLRECPSVRILATSREPLGLSGENVYQVDPLSIPPTGQRSTRCGHRVRGGHPARRSRAAPDSRLRGHRRERRRRRATCATVSTAFRSPSSSPQPGSGRSPPRRSLSVSTIVSAF